MSSSSKSSTSSTQQYNSTTQDNRIVADAGAVTFSQAQGNTINSASNDHSITNTTYQSLDAGAVGKAFDFAEAIGKGAASTSVASVGAMGDFSVDALKAVKDAYSGSAAASERAYSGAMGEVSGIAKQSMNGAYDMAGKAMDTTSTAWGKAVGAIGDNMKLSLNAITSTNKEANDHIRNANSDVAAAYKGVNETLSDAWQSSKAGEQKMLAFGLLAIVGLVVAKVMGGR